jgi:hypothetical protein
MTVSVNNRLGLPSGCARGCPCQGVTERNHRLSMGCFHVKDRPETSVLLGAIFDVKKTH